MSSNHQTFQGKSSEDLSWFLVGDYLFGLLVCTFVCVFVDRCVSLSLCLIRHTKNLMHTKKSLRRKHKRRNGREKKKVYHEGSTRIPDRFQSLGGGED